jgi:hypothetical protein
MVAGVAAAAGGPKWFTTYGLVRYIVDDLLDDDQSRFYIGSSVGSWHPGRALERLRKAYAEYIYTEDPGPGEISDACADIIKQMVSDQTDYILNNKSKSLYVTTSRGRGLCNSEQKAKLLPGLALAALSHTVTRLYESYHIL